MQAESMSVGIGSEDLQGGKGWKSVTSGTRRKASAPSQVLHLQNRFNALIADKRLGALSSEAPKQTKPDPHSSTNRKL